MARTLLETHKHPQYPRLALDLRADSRFYQARTYLDGKVWLKSTKTGALPTAFKIAEVWYKAQLKASVSEARQHPLDKLTTDPTIGELFANYRLTLPKHRREYVDIKWGAIGYYWRAITAPDVTPQLIREFYRSRRRKKTQMGTVVTNNTLHKDITLLRQILTYAVEEGHLSALPSIPKSGKIEANPRPWLTRSEWDTLRAESAERLKEADGNAKLKVQRQDLHDFVLWLVESMLRIDELRELTCGQVKVVTGPPKHLLLDVQGKRGHRTTVVAGEAVKIFERRSQGLKASDRLFPVGQRDAFRELLIAAKLRTDSFGNTRNLKSLRATAISMRILAGAPSPNLLAIARSAGTSLAMLDEYYAKRLGAELFGAELTQSVLRSKGDAYSWEDWGGNTSN